MTEPGPDLAGWLEFIGSVHPTGWDLGLERVAEVAGRLNLEHPAHKVILVAGTNGKGSTCEYLEQFALANGLTVGKSTSPHLIRFNERIAINGTPVPDAAITSAFEEINQARAEVTLTYFEFATLASLLIFRESGLDVAILEVGLGGRLDAMNVVHPDLTIITAIDLDHQSYLGHTRADIAREKAGIMRQDIPCLVSDPAPPGSLIAHASRLGAPLRRIGVDFPMATGLATHLPEASLAVAAEGARLLGWSLKDMAAIADETRLAGRRTWARLHCDVLLDVAHNPAAAASLADYLAGLDQYAAIHALAGMYADKDIEGVTGLLAAHIKTWHLTASDEPRAESPARLKARLSADQSGNVITCDKIAEAFAGVVSSANEDDLILVFGSFSVVGTCLQLLSDRNP